MLNEQVVLDTDTPIVYIGTLTEIMDDALVLADTDMHDCRDGHANREVYLAEARDAGVAVNRRNVVVMRSVIISISRLADIAIE